jgi:hypothetical protein
VAAWKKQGRAKGEPPPDKPVEPQVQRYIVNDITVRRFCGRAKQFLTAAVRRRLIPSNPFADLKSVVQANPSRFYFVTREEVQKVIDACPDAQWRLLVALSRYGGLRCPSEHLALRWGDVDWEQAEPGTEFVITRYRDSRVNLRAQMERIIRKAGLEPWQRLWQNMRSTRETELAERFPMHVVCKWLGNSQPVAAKHYLQVTDEHFREAVRQPAQNPAQQTHAQACMERKTENAAHPDCEALQGVASNCHLMQIHPTTLPGPVRRRMTGPEFPSQTGLQTGDSFSE